MQSPNRQRFVVGLGLEVVESEEGQVQPSVDQVMSGMVVGKLDNILAQCPQFYRGRASAREDILIFLLTYVQLYRQPSHPDFLF